MLIIPAIDIIEGKVVRLSKGSFDSVVNYEKSPIEQAKMYSDQGFEWIHIVDLSGSKDGKITSLDIIEDIKNKTNLKIEFGGGVRSKKDVIVLKKSGIDGIIIGSFSIANREDFETIFDDIDPSKIIIAADVLDYKIRIKGWTENSMIHLFDHIEYCSKFGIENFLCTDISVDGMLTGPNFKLYEEILRKYPLIKLTASGGISSIKDILQLKKMPVRGVVVGKAIYENKINLEELSKLAV